MKKYIIWDNGEMVGIMELTPDEVEKLQNGGLEVYEVKQA